GGIGRYGGSAVVGFWPAHTTTGNSMQRKIKQMPNTGICVFFSANVGPRSSVQFLVWLIQFRKILMEKRDGFNPFEVVCDVVLFVWRMQIVAIQPKAHQYRFQSEFVFE